MSFQQNPEIYKGKEKEEWIWVENLGVSAAGRKFVSQYKDAE